MKGESMRYYVVADVHGYHDIMIDALAENGYFKDKEPHKLIICGDLFDRGAQTLKMQEFVADLIDKDEVILIRGNHEDLMLDLLEHLQEYLYAPGSIECTHHHQNGTFKTALTLSRMNRHDLDCYPQRFVNTVRNSLYIKKIIPAMVDYFETDNYVFVHGWIPCHQTVYRSGEYTYTPLSTDWRCADEKQWERARWYNGMASWKCGVTEPSGKTVVCGHYRTSWGHSWLHNEGTDLGVNDILTPFCDKGIIALDACTKRSLSVNCIVIED